MKRSKAMELRQRQYIKLLLILSIGLILSCGKEELYLNSPTTILEDSVGYVEPKIPNSENSEVSTNRILVCHKLRKSMLVRVDSLQDHLNHSDSIGECK